MIRVGKTVGITWCPSSSSFLIRSLPPHEIPLGASRTLPPTHQSGQTEMGSARALCVKLNGRAKSLVHPSHFLPGREMAKMPGPQINKRRKQMTHYFR